MKHIAALAVIVSVAVIVAMGIALYAKHLILGRQRRRLSSVAPT